jgi:hypothetical protein
VSAPSYEAILAAPADDAPRLFWADATGGERGELVVIQCELARGGLPRDAAIARRRRETELLDKNGAAWAGLEGLSKDWTFRRGFVESASVDAKTFVERSDALFAAAPVLQEVYFEGLDGSDVQARLTALLHSPAFRRLPGAGFDAPGETVETDSDFHPTDFQSAGDHLLGLLLEPGTMRGLRWLRLNQCGLSSEAVKRLVASPDVAGLTSLDLSFQVIDRYMGLYPDGVAAVLDAPHLGKLERLDAAGALGRHAWYGGQTRQERADASRKQAEQDPQLLSHPRLLGLRDLGMAHGNFADGMVPAIAAAPFTRLERLDLSANDLRPDELEKLGAAPGLAGLRELCLNGPNDYVFGPKHAEALGAASRLDSLRVVRLRRLEIDGPTAKAFLDSKLAKRLELVDIRRNVERKALPANGFDGILLA